MKQRQPLSLSSVFTLSELVDGMYHLTSINETIISSIVWIWKTSTLKNQRQLLIYLLDLFPVVHTSALIWKIIEGIAIRS